MLTKEKLIETINRLPEKFTLDDVMERIVLLAKIEKGLQQIEEGKVLSNDEMKKRLGKWLD